jgi:hypothetical protein
MANPQDHAVPIPPDVTARKLSEDRRSQARSNTVLSRIEDMTYEILRKHEKQSA